MNWWREVKKRKWRKWNLKFIIVLFISQHHNNHQNQSFHWFHQIGNWNENQKTKRENVNERKENGWIYWKIIGMTSVCFYFGEQKENVSLLFHGVWNELFKWISQFVSFPEIELWHPHVESEMNVSQLFISLLIWLSLQSHSFERCLLLSKLNQWSRCEMSDLRRERTKREFERKTRKSILKILLPFRGRAFCKKKKPKTTRDNRQASSFLIPHLNAWPEARGGFGSAADVCCLKLQIDWI